MSTRTAHHLHSPHRKANVPRPLGSSAGLVDQIRKVRLRRYLAVAARSGEGPFTQPFADREKVESLHTVNRRPRATLWLLKPSLGKDQAVSMRPTISQEKPLNAISGSVNGVILCQNEPPSVTDMSISAWPSRRPAMPLSA